MSSAHGSSQSAGTVAVRRLTEADWRQLRAARLAALAEAPYAFASTLARERQFTEETWRERARSAMTVAAFEGTDIVGLATGFPEQTGTGWHLVGMWVAPEIRGQGIAGRLVGAVCAMARQAGAPSVTLWVTDANDRARAFYRRLGFEATGGRQLVRPDEPDQWEDELRLDLS
jgi:ribosomal protein S18 acetylase RimI-like enzyme